MNDRELARRDSREAAERHASDLENDRRRIAEAIVEYARRKGFDPRDASEVHYHLFFIWKELEAKKVLRSGMKYTGMIKQFSKEVHRLVFGTPGFGNSGHAADWRADTEHQLEHRNNPQIEWRDEMENGNESEMQGLRDIITKQQNRIDVLEKAVSAMPEADLNQLSSQGASWYVKEKCKNMPITEKTLVLNAVAHGVFMGYRKAEQIIGDKKDYQNREWEMQNVESEQS